MIYLWKTPAKFYESIIGDDLDRYIGIYNEEKGPKYSLLNNGLDDGKLFNFSKEELIFEFKTTKYELIVNDILENDSSFIIVNERVKKVLNQFASKDIQYLIPRIICTNGELNNYSIVNILPRVSGIDREKSQCEFFSFAPNKISGFKFGKGTMVYKQDCLGDHHIAIEKDFGIHVVISQQLKDALCNLYPPIKEVSFILPEEMQW